jgi:hypothetical protein
LTKPCDREGIVLTKLIAFWNNLPPNTKQWLRGAEIAVVTGVVASFVAAPATDFSSAKGVTEFAAGVATAAYGALRLYMTQSPITALVTTKTASETVAVGAVSQTVSSTETVTQGGTK